MLLQSAHTRSSRQTVRLAWVAAYAGVALAVLVAQAGTLASPAGAVLGDPGGDMRGYHEPVLRWMRGVLLAGRLPLWNPLVFCGYPQWAEAQTAWAGPLAFLVWLPPHAALNLAWVAVQVCTGLAAVWWFAGLRVAPLAAFLGGAGVALGGPVVMRMAGGHPNIAACLPWMLACLGAWWRWWEGRGRGFLMLAAASVAAMFWSGHVQTVFHFLLFAPALTLFAHGVGTRAALLRWARGGAIVALAGAASSAAILFPASELGVMSMRGKLTVYDASTFSFPVENLLTLVVPGCFGDGVLEASGHPGAVFVGRWYHAWEASLLFSPVLLVFAFAPARPRHRSLVRALWAAAALCFVLALGRQAPLYQLAYHVLPGFGLFRCHGRLMTPVLLSLATLGVLGFDRWARGGWPGAAATPRRHHRALAWAAAAALVALALFAWAVRAPGGPAGAVVAPAASLPLMGGHLELFPRIPPGTSLAYIMGSFTPAMRAETFARAGVRAAAGWGALLAAALAASLALRGRMAQAAVLAAVGTAVLAWWGRPYLVRDAMEDAALPRSAVTALRDISGATGRAMLLGPGDRNCLLREGVAGAAGYAAVLGRRQNTLLQIAQNHPETTQESQSNARELTPVSRWLGVRALIATDKEVAATDGPAPAYSEGATRVWDAGPCVPYASLVDGGVAVASFEDAAARLRQTGREGADQPVLETAAEIRPATTAPLALWSERPAPGEIRVDLRGTGAGWVVVLESLMPGWKARLDGVPAPVVPAQAAFQAVRVPAGANELSLKYQPFSFRLGAFVALAGLAFLLAQALCPRDRDGERAAARALSAPPRRPGADGPREARARKPRSSRRGRRSAIP
jgi:hypothetical protein